MEFPKLYKIKQRFDTSVVEDIPTRIIDELNRVEAEKQIKGKKIGITAGSRGIKNVDIMYKTVIDYVRQKGGSPYLIAAMGSHGGGTVEGQLSILEGLNVTE